jgi:hypothetical protein
MPQFAKLTSAPPLKKKAAPAAARPQPRRSSPAQRAAIAQVLQRRAAESAAAEAAPKAPNRTGLPKMLKAGVERLSGLAMDDVRVHRNSAEPAKLGALAYTKGTDIHVGPGQEQHLPHEAWHVVQQKQGRVRATAQMKGVALNEDAGLEAEADRMGSRIDTAPAAEPQSNQSAPPMNREVVQRVIMLDKKELMVPATGASTVITKYINYKPTYYMRNDWTESSSNYLKKTINIIEKKVYLLGEEHDKSNWAINTSLWKIQKMDEYLKTFGIYSMKGDKKDKNEGYLPLEDLHPYVLQQIIIINHYANVICAPRNRNRWLYVPDGYGDFARVMENRDKWQGYYSWYCEQIKREGAKSDSEKLICTFATNLAKYVIAINDLFKNFNELWAAMEPENVSMATLKDYFDKIEATRPIMRSMIADLTAISSVKSGSTDMALITAAKASSAASNADIVRAAGPLRERSMAAHINLQPRPLLVKLGDAHLTGVSTDVSGSVKVPHGTLFQTITEKKE